MFKLDIKCQQTVGLFAFAVFIAKGVSDIQHWLNAPVCGVLVRQAIPH